MAPTWTCDLSVALEKLIRCKPPEVLHVAASGRGSWYDVAGVIAERIGVPELVSPVDSDGFPRAARRPEAALLDCSAFESCSGWSMPDWRASVEAYLAGARISELLGQSNVDGVDNPDIYASGEPDA